MSNTPGKETETLNQEISRGTGLGPGWRIALLILTLVQLAIIYAQPDILGAWQIIIFVPNALYLGYAIFDGLRTATRRRGRADEEKPR